MAFSVSSLPSPPSAVLVTGASGFIGSWVCRTLLEAGYRVRATVRDAAKGEYLKTLFSDFSIGFDYVIVQDFTKPQAYQEAVKGELSGVVHIAGPTTFNDADLDDFKLMMVDATVNLLECIRASRPQFVVDTAVSGAPAQAPPVEGLGSNAKCKYPSYFTDETYSMNSKSIKRFIYMSSAQALLGKLLGHVYGENDWNDGAVTAIEADLSKCDGQTRYQAGKVLAERAVLSFPDKYGGSKALGWDVVSLVPVWTYGPVIHQFHSLENLNFSSVVFYRHMTEAKDKTQLNSYGSDYVDVRDLSMATVLALQVESAGGQRFILDAGSYMFQNLHDVLNDEPALSGVQIGDPDAPKFNLPGPFCDSSKAKETLNFSFRTLKETARDSLASYREKGIQ